MGRSDGPGKYDLAAESPRGSAKGGFMSGEECENARHEKGKREGEVSRAMDDTEMTLPRILEEVYDFICRNVSEERESSASSPDMSKVIELFSEKVETAIARYSSGSRLGSDEDGLVQSVVRLAGVTNKLKGASQGSNGASVIPPRR